jgi:hypothetical protein
VVGVARRVSVFCVVWAREGAATSSRAERSRRRVVIGEDEDSARPMATEAS